MLTENESILYSELAKSILKDLNEEYANRIFLELRENFEIIKNRRVFIIDKILDSIPEAWNANLDIVKNKIVQLFGHKWMDECWNTFITYFNEATK